MPNLSERIIRNSEHYIGILALVLILCLNIVNIFFSELTASSKVCTVVYGMSKALLRIEENLVPGGPVPSLEVPSLQIYGQTTLQNNQWQASMKYFPCSYWFTQKKPVFLTLKSANGDYRTRNRPSQNFYSASCIPFCQVVCLLVVKKLSIVLNTSDFKFYRCCNFP
jgi:hypothetical protein